MAMSTMVSGVRGVYKCDVCCDGVRFVKYGGCFGCGYVWDSRVHRDARWVKAKTDAELSMQRQKGQGFTKWSDKNEY